MFSCPRIIHQMLANPLFGNRFLRGEIISYTTWEDRNRKQCIKDLTDQIHQLDYKYSTAPTPELLKERSALQTEFVLTTTHYTEQLLLQSRSNLYEHSHKAGRTLAQHIRQFTASTLITNIRKHDGQISNDEQEINNEFKVFYSSLYTSEGIHDPSRLKSFFQSMDLHIWHLWNNWKNLCLWRKLDLLFTACRMLNLQDLMVSRSNSLRNLEISCCQFYSLFLRNRLSRANFHPHSLRLLSQLY